MANHYISQQNGNDANDAHSVVNAKATIGSLITAGIAAGDVVYIGPGTYREAVTMAVSGNAGARIKFYGDPGARYLTNDKPGVVRVTRCDANETAQSGSCVWDFGTRQYIDIYDLFIDGTSDASGSYAAINGYDNITVNRCVAIGTWRGMAVGGQIYNSILVGGEAGAGACDVYDSILFGGNYAGYGANYYGCIGFGGLNGGFRNFTTARNCLAIGGAYGFWSAASGTMYNCVAMANQRGFYWNGAASPPSWVNCASLNCGYGYSNSSSTYKPTVTSCLAYQCNTLRETADANYTGLPTVGNAAYFLHMESYMLLVKAFEPLLVLTGLRDVGNNTYDPTNDILGRPHEPASSTCDIGPYEQPNTQVSFTAGDYQTAAPGIKILLAGQYQFNVAGKAGDTVTVKVQTKWVNATTKPQVILSGRSITTQTATNTAASNTWQELTVSAVLAEDDLLTLTLYAQDNTANHVSYFSDFVITVA